MTASFIIGVLLYFSIGLFWKELLERIIILTGTSTRNFNLTESIMAILLWPLSLSIFIVSYIVALFNE